MPALAAHYDALLAQGRCGRCAERVPRAAVLRQAACGRCRAPLRTQGRGDLLAKLDQRRWKWRLLGYGLVGLAGLVSGVVPLLPWAVQVAALVLLHVALLRQPLRWLSPARRLTTRLTIKLLSAAVVCLSLAVNVVVTPLLGLGAVLVGVASFSLTALSIEGGLLIIRQRLRWEAEGQPLRRLEWGVPAGLLGATALGALGSVAVIVGALYAIERAEIPHVSDVAQFLLEF